MKILYIGENIKFPQNGGDMIECRNQRLLEKISEGNIKYMNPEIQGTRSLSSRIGMGVSASFLKLLEIELKECRYNLVFVSQSYYGRVTRFIKKNIKTIPVINFFHNAESDFFYDSYKMNKSIRTYLYYRKASIWEKCSSKYADKIITLNVRDSMRLKMLYGRESDFILPTTFTDSYEYIEKESCDIDYLFLGSSFFANKEGVQFFLDEVFPNIPGRFCVAGKNMEKVDFRNINERVTILGFIENLNEIYARSRYIVSPIFSGSGMKTKTAEALMYGKTIIGTKEAFEGYSIDPNCMIVCNNTQEFVNTLNNLYIMKEPKVNEHARKHFLDNYSDTSIFPSFKNFIVQICQ